VRNPPACRGLGLGLSAALAAFTFASAAAPSPSVPPGALATGVEVGDVPQLEARLLVAPAPDARGHRRVGVLFDLAPGWHIYAKDPGESGVATALEFRAEGARFRELPWPLPESFRESDGLFTTYGYAGRFVLGAELEPTSEAPRAGILTARAEYLACRDECVPGEFELTRELGGAETAPDAAAAQALLAALPGAPADPEVAGPAPAAALGLELWLRALLLAFLGGVVLNGMPCVLPVLVMKVLAVTEIAHAQRREALRHGLAYGAGVIGSMAALAAIVLALRAAGAAVGWGFQFQEPAFVACVAALVVVFALNLFGVFEITPNTGELAGFGAAAAGWRRSFFDGLLAVVLATPCSAPFLGTAVGFAFAGSAPLAAAIFAAIGAGLASPFVLISALPGLARFVPKPGAWMLQLRAVLGFSLLATAAWLVWVLGRNAGVDAAGALLALLVALAFLAWTLGALQRAGRRGATLAVVPCAALVLFAGLDWVGVEPAAVETEAQAAASREQRGIETWEPARITEHLAQGRRVFVAFSADWCITCKLNEKRVLAAEEVEAAFERNGIARMHADWTRRDSAIGAELLRHGRAGVPLYLLYDPERPEAPEVLPELLSQRDVLERLDRKRSPARREPLGERSS
jgi:thiol:disulfide interchange protein DsbD